MKVNIEPNLALFEEVKRRILADPVNLDMNAIIHESECGTVACIAGHVALIVFEASADKWITERALMAEEAIESRQDVTDFGWSNLSWAAIRALGLHIADAFWLFQVDGWMEPFKSQYQSREDELKKMRRHGGLETQKEKVLEIKQQMAEITCSRIDHFIAISK
ncbi:MAG: hypothetical protein WBB28_20655 [Crinalium sp.]